MKLTMKIECPCVANRFPFGIRQSVFLYADRIGMHIPPLNFDIDEVARWDYQTRTSSAASSAGGR